MAHYLLKTEPSTYSFADLVRDGRTRWDGITNPVALKHLRGCRRGDVAIIYHTGDEKAAIGLAEIAGDPYVDSKNEKLWVVDLIAKHPLARAVTLAELKAEPAFADSPLVRQGRLSFVPIEDRQWKTIEKLAKSKR